MWSWKNSGDELHNIVRVGCPDSDVRTVDIKLAATIREFTQVLPLLYVKNKGL